MKQQDEVRKELESLSPHLLRLKKRSGKGSFRVPPDYFRDLPDEVMRRIEREAVAQPPARRIRRLGYALAVAATVLLLIIAISLLRRVSTAPAPDPLALSEEEISEYIHANIDAFDLALLLESEEEADSWLPADDIYTDGEEEEWVDELLDEIEWEELLEDTE